CDPLPDAVGVARRHDLYDGTTAGVGEDRSHDPGAEAGADDEHLHRHSPSTSAYIGTGRWKRSSATCVIGAHTNASTTVPTPTVPPSSQPTSSTLNSMVSRTRHTGSPRFVR